MEFNYINDDEKLFHDLLGRLEQTHILEEIPKHSTEERQAFVEQLKKLNTTYPGGLQAYFERARKLLKESAEDVNPYEGFVPKPPPTENIDFRSQTIDELEEIGAPELGNTAFVLVAGGLGERLGYDGIKVEIPIDLITETCFLKYYVRYILAYQRRYSPSRPIPLAIMVSDDTHALTLKLLEGNNYFGMPKEQITIMKQEKVPALLDNDAHFALVPGKLEIETKPHGHGDVHTLLYQSQLISKWASEGRKYVVFFQDTNPLIFRSLPAILGVSKKRNFEINSVVVPRKPGEAVGALCTLERPNAAPLTINVEYNQLSSLFKGSGGEKVDEQGFSTFPGNINCLVFSVPEFAQTLEHTQGSISEFINPKYADATKTKFKSPTRLECMMQDYPKLLKDCARVGVTQIGKEFCFSACKNDLQSAVTKVKSGLPAESSSSCEFDLYQLNAEILRLAGANVQKGEPVTHAGVILPGVPKVVLMPEFGVTLKEIRNKIKGNVTLTPQSTVVLDGDIVLENVNIDGSVFIFAEPGKQREVKDLNVTGKNYIQLQDLEANTDEPTYKKIRGYTAANREQATYV